MAFGKRPGDYGMSWGILQILQIFPRVEYFCLYFLEPARLPNLRCCLYVCQFMLATRHRPFATPKLFFFGTYMNFIGSSSKQQVLVGKVLNILKEDLTFFLLLLETR